MVSERFAKRAARRKRVRRKVRGTDQRPRLSVYRSLRYIYAQVISDESGRTLAAESTLSLARRGELTRTCNIEAARALGRAIAQKCQEKGIKTVVFDRNGFLYHGRIKAVAEAAREAGLIF